MSGKLPFLKYSPGRRGQQPFALITTRTGTMFCRGQGREGEGGLYKQYSPCVLLSTLQRVSQHSATVDISVKGSPACS